MGQVLPLLNIATNYADKINTNLNKLDESTKARSFIFLAAVDGVKQKVVVRQLENGKRELTVGDQTVTFDKGKRAADLPAVITSSAKFEKTREAAQSATVQIATGSGTFLKDVREDLFVARLAFDKAKKFIDSHPGIQSMDFNKINTVLNQIEKDGRVTLDTLHNLKSILMSDSIENAVTQIFQAAGKFPELEGLYVDDIKKQISELSKKYPELEELKNFAKNWDQTLTQIRWLVVDSEDEIASNTTEDDPDLWDVMQQAKEMQTAIVPAEVSANGSPQKFIGIEKAEAMNLFLLKKEYRDSKDALDGLQSGDPKSKALIESGYFLENFEQFFDASFVGNPKERLEQAVAFAAISQKMLMTQKFLDQLSLEGQITPANLKTLTAALNDMSDIKSNLSGNESNVFKNRDMNTLVRNWNKTMSQLHAFLEKQAPDKAQTQIALSKALFNVHEAHIDLSLKKL